MLRNLAKLGALLFGRLPGQLVIQVTNYCNASCPQCGMRKSASIARHQLGEPRVRRILDQCAANGIDAVSLTGGEPFIKPAELLDLLNYAAGRGIGYLRSGTNGYMFTREGRAADTEEIDRFAEALAATGIRNFWISLDSADTRTHEIMRGLPGVVEGIKKALPLFHDRGLYPAVNLGINRNIMGAPIPPIGEIREEDLFVEAYRVGFAAFFSKAIALGFTMANVCYPMSSVQEELDDGNAPYGAISGDPAVDFSPAELRLVFRALREISPRFRDRIRIFTPLSVLYALSKEDASSLFPCLGGCAYFYMDSKDGRLYPCGYRGDEDLGEDLGGALGQSRKRRPYCKKCHWECFRDPSQLFGVARYLIRHPVRCLIEKRIDPRMLKLWFDDIGYYMRNDFFNGRRPPGAAKKKETA
jgi:MoaA/NifB/PqqE/SkfB family radical SAM enzyme